MCVFPLQLIISSAITSHATSLDGVASSVSAASYCWLVHYSEIKSYCNCNHRLSRMDRQYLFAQSILTRLFPSELQSDKTSVLPVFTWAELELVCISPPHSRRSHCWHPAAGSSVCGGLRHLLQVWLLGFSGEGHHDLCRWRWSCVCLQCEFKIMNDTKWYIIL